MYDSASRTGFPPGAERGAGYNCDLSIDMMLNKMAANEMPLKINNQPVPHGPTKSVASAGPKMREPVIAAVFSDTALLMFFGSTSSITRPRRAGLSNAFTTPKMSDKTYTAGSEILLVRSRMPRANACIASPLCVNNVRRKRLYRSDSAPAHAPSNNIGKNWNMTFSPRSVAFPVRR